jgi:hypothetical protein
MSAERGRRIERHNHRDSDRTAGKSIGVVITSVSDALKDIDIRDGAITAKASDRGVEVVPVEDIVIDKGVVAVGALGLTRVAGVHTLGTLSKPIF